MLLEDKMNYFYELADYNEELGDEYYTESGESFFDKIKELIAKIRKRISSIFTKTNEKKLDMNEKVNVVKSTWGKIQTFLTNIKKFINFSVDKLLSTISKHKIAGAAGIGIVMAVTATVMGEKDRKAKAEKNGIPVKRSEIKRMLEDCDKIAEQIENRVSELKHAAMNLANKKEINSEIDKQAKQARLKLANKKAELKDASKLFPYVIDALNKASSNVLSVVTFLTALITSPATAVLMAYNKVAYK